ncbi:MAG: VOC family protein [Alphaproteobacteria bacterium]
MPQRVISGVTILVPSYADGLAFFRDKLGFTVLEDIEQGQGKRWLVMAPGTQAGQARIILAVPSNEAQMGAMGNQNGGRVGFFLQTDDFDRDYADFASKGVKFAEDPRQEPHGKVAVFEDDFGNLWDLIQPE